MMIVCAGIIGAIVTEEMHITHLQFLDSLDFAGVVGHDGIYPLAVAVARDRGEGLSG